MYTPEGLYNALDDVLTRKEAIKIIAEAFEKYYDKGYSDGCHNTKIETPA